MQHINKVLISIINSSFLEIVAKTPVTQHFKHCVMAKCCITPHLFQVVMLTTYTQAFL